MSDEPRISIAENHGFDDVRGVVVDVSTLAKLTGFDRGTISKWITDEELPTLSGGSAGVPYAISLRAFIEWRETVAADEIRKKLPKGNFVGFMGATTPRESIAASTAYMKFEALAKNLVPRQFVLDTIARALNSARVSITSIPDRLYRDKSGFPPELTAKWREEARKTCVSALDKAASSIEQAMLETADPDDDPSDR